MMSRFLTVLALLSLLLFISAGLLWLWHPGTWRHWQCHDGTHYVLNPTNDGLLLLRTQAPQQPVGGMVVRRADVTRLPYRSLLLATAMLPILWLVKLIARKHASRFSSDRSLKPR